MTARVWTREELDRVHPLPEGWAWHWDTTDEHWEALTFSGYFDEDGERVADGWCYVENDIPYNDGGTVQVVLAVILASKGLDSFDAMARAMETAANDNARRAATAFTDEHAARVEGMADAYEESFKMLRRGTVAG
jgi:hypothetical protein